MLFKTKRRTMKHILSIQDFSREEIEEILANARQMLINRNKGNLPIKLSSHQQPKATLLFTEPSTRTCRSYEEAARQCGFYVTVLTNKEMTSLKKGETLADTARMLAGQGADILIIRTPQEGAARFVAEILDKSNYQVSVQNGGDGANQHPTQALLDLFTIFQLLGRLDNFIYGAIGDLRFSRVIHSTLQALVKFKNIKIRLASLPETRLPPQYKLGFEEILEDNNLSVLADCDIIEATRIQEERFTDPTELERVRKTFVIDQYALDKIFKPTAFILHPLPRREEIDPAISNNPRVKMFLQADLGIPLRMALITMGYQGRTKKTDTPSFNTSVWQEIVRQPIDEHLGNSEKKQTYFRPIREGTVIDHLPLYMADILKTAFGENLKAVDGQVIHSIQGVPSQRHRLKDVMVLERVFLDDNDLATIAFLVPDVTFNIIKEGIFRKLKIETLPSQLRKILRCPNPVCITRSEPEAETKFSPISKNEVECYYCNRIFSREEMIRILKK